MSQMSRTEQIIAEKTVCMLLVKGESPEGTPIYAYVAVRADKLETFMKAQQEGMFYPDEYGMIVESGEGEPDPEVRKRMEDEYGFNHQAMLDIPSNVTPSDIAQNVREMRARQEESSGDE